MKKLLGILLCGMLVFSACGQEEQPPEKKELIYETLDTAKEAHLERCPEERLEDVIEVAENTHLAIYTQQITTTRDVALNKVAFVRYVLYQEMENGFVPTDDTAPLIEVDTFALYTVDMETPWLGEGKTIAVTAQGFADDPYAEEQPNVEGFDEVYQQENGWFGVRVE